MNSCSMLAVDAAGKEITTVEGIADGDKLSAVQQAFVERKGLHISLRAGMSQVLVDVEESNALGSVIAVHGLQTGDPSQERRSRQTAEDQHRVMFFQALQHDFRNMVSFIKLR